MEELTRLRVERGWSQQRLADESGVNKATINQIERGRRSPNVETLEKLANALGAGVADFFPKAQAPLWSHEQSEWRPFIFHEARVNLEEYCKRWERLVSEGKLDDTSIRQFFETGQGWLPMLDVALRAELDGLRSTTGLKGRELLARSEIAQANKRYLKLFGKVVELFEGVRSGILDDPETPETNVIRLEEVRERLAGMPVQMFG
jgi:transcriptional regulator with XRE-family HTH domain